MRWLFKGRLAIIATLTAIALPTYLQFLRAVQALGD